MEDCGDCDGDGIDALTNVCAMVRAEGGKSDEFASEEAMKQWASMAMDVSNKQVAQRAWFLVLILGRCGGPTWAALVVDSGLLAFMLKVYEEEPLDCAWFAPVMEKYLQYPLLNHYACQTQVKDAVGASSLCARVLAWFKCAWLNNEGELVDEATARLHTLWCVVHAHAGNAARLTASKDAVHTLFALSTCGHPEVHLLALKVLRVLVVFPEALGNVIAHGFIPFLLDGFFRNAWTSELNMPVAFGLLLSVARLNVEPQYWPPIAAVLVAALTKCSDDKWLLSAALQCLLFLAKQQDCVHALVSAFEQHPAAWSAVRAFQDVTDGPQELCDVGRRSRLIYRHVAPVLVHRLRCCTPPSDWRCSVCLDDHVVDVVQPCLHVFHRECLLQAVRAKVRTQVPACPLRCAHFFESISCEHSCCVPPHT